MPSAKFLLVRHAFIYIHFPVLCEPPTISREKKSGETAAINFIPNRFSSRFSTCRTNGLRLLSQPKTGIHTRLSEKNRTQRLTRRNRGVLDGGAITTLGLFHTFRKPCAAGYQNGVLCRFGDLVKGTLEERRKPSEQRCAYACRCSEASRPRWAA